MNGITVGMTTLNWFIRSRTETDKKTVRQNPKFPSQVPSEKPEITEDSSAQNQQQEKVRKSQLDVAQQTEKNAGTVEPINAANSESSEIPPGEPRKFNFKPSEVDAKKLM